MNLFLHGKTFLATAAVAFTLAVAVLNAAPNNRTFPPADPMKKETQIPVSLGKTSLLDIGLYQVTCQSYGKETISLPPNFMGSDTTTGVIYDPSFQQDVGRLPAAAAGSDTAEAAVRRRHAPWRR